MAEGVTDKPPRRMRHVVFAAILCFLWVIVLCLALEFYEHWRLTRIVTRNPWVLATEGKLPWSSVPGAINSGISGNRVEEGPTLREQAGPIASNPEAANAAPGPDAVPGYPETKDELLRRVERFAGMSEEDRARFDTGLGDRVLLCDAAGNARAFYQAREWNEGGADEKRPLPSALPAPLREAVSHVAETRTPEALLTNVSELDKEPLACFAFPFPKAAGGGVGVALRTPYKSDPSTPWDLPWYRFKLGWEHPTWMYSLNRQGFRDDDVELPKPPGVFRIVCIGGSTTEEGATNATTYPNLLEAELNARFGGSPRIDVVNCGVSGILTSGERARTFDYLALEPDLLLFYEGVNDLVYTRVPRWRESLPVGKRLLGMSSFVRRVWNDWFWPDPKQAQADIERTMLRHLHTLIETARARGIDAAICSFAYSKPRAGVTDEWGFAEYQTLKFVAGGDLYYKTYRSLVAAMNAAFRDYCTKQSLLYIAVAEEMPDGATYFGDICHMRHAGTEQKVAIIARAVGAYLERRLGQ